MSLHTLRLLPIISMPMVAAVRQALAPSQATSSPLGPTLRPTRSVPQGICRGARAAARDTAQPAGPALNQRARAQRWPCTWTRRTFGAFGGGYLPQDSSAGCVSHLHPSKDPDHTCRACLFRLFRLFRRDACPEPGLRHYEPPRGGGLRWWDPGPLPRR